MKNYSINQYIKAFATGLFLIVFALGGYSQTSYNCSIKNITQVDLKTLTFEVWLQNTGSTGLKLEALQAGINFNYDGLSNGGIITGAFVPGTANGVMPGSTQYSPDWNINQTSKQIRLLPAMEFSYAFPTNIPNSGGGIRIGRFIMTNTVNFATATPNFTWSFANGSGYTTETIVDCYVNGSDLGTDITNTSNQIVIGNPVINQGMAAIPTLSEWGLILLGGLMVIIGSFYVRKIV